MTARLPATKAALPLLRLVHIHRLEPAFDRLPLVEAWQRRCALFRHEGRFIAVRVAEQDAATQRWVEERAGEEVEWYRVTDEDMVDWLQKQSEASSTLKNLLQRAKVGAGGTAPAPRTVVPTSPLGAEASHDTEALTQFVQRTLEAGLRQGASDVHFETAGFGLVVRQRIDGVLETVCEMGGRGKAAETIAHLKALVGAGEARMTRSVISLGGRRVPVRLSLLSGLNGENAILSILEKPRLVRPGGVLEIERLGFSSEDCARLHLLAAEPYGLVLVAGPRDSGRTTTLLAMLADACNGFEKTVSVEAEISHTLPGVLQIPVAEGRYGSMSDALRAAMQHDPDRIMVDPLWDATSSRLALAAALDGRRVLVAVGGNHVFDALARFAHDAGAAPLLAEALNGIIAQRLVRMVCPHCAERIVPSPGEFDALALPPEARVGGFRRGTGCGACRTTGYLGRRVIAEILVLDERLRALIGQRAPLSEIKAEARRQGWQSLRESALQLARTGLTTLAEVARVTRQT